MRKQKKAKKLVLGITGGFASGKSTVARFFHSVHSQIIDADKISRAFLKPGTSTYRKIVAEFGSNILSPAGNIQRTKLAKVVFHDQRSLRKLNRIIHPPAIKAIKARIKSSRKKLIILDAALIIEAGLRGLVDKLIVVKANPGQQVCRGSLKFALSKTEARQRIKFQAPLRAKTRLADFIIDNCGSFAQTKKQVNEIRRKLWKS